jgi:hypothetical protein
MLVVPIAKPVAKPVLLIVAAAALDELQVTELVRFCVLLSLHVPVAANCCWPPMEIEGLAGVTAIDTSTGGPTVSPVEPVIEPSSASIVAVPVATPVARPAPVIVATDVAEESQVTELVKFCVLPLL